MLIYKILAHVFCNGPAVSVISHGDAIFHQVGDVILNYSKVKISGGKRRKQKKNSIDKKENLKKKSKKRKIKRKENNKKKTPEDISRRQPCSDGGTKKIKMKHLITNFKKIIACW